MIPTASQFTGFNKAEIEFNIMIFATHDKVPYNFLCSKKNSSE